VGAKKNGSAPARAPVSGTSGFCNQAARNANGPCRTAVTACGVKAYIPELSRWPTTCSFHHGGSTSAEFWAARTSAAVIPRTT